MYSLCVCHSLVGFKIRTPKIIHNFEEFMHMGFNKVKYLQLNYSCVHALRNVQKIQIAVDIKNCNRIALKSNKKKHHFVRFFVCFLLMSTKIYYSHS